MDNRQTVVIAVSAVFFVLASIFVGLYISSCLFVVKKVRLADYLMLLAWLIDLGMAVSLFYAVGKGFGLHEHDIESHNEVALNKAAYVFEVLYVCIYPPTSSKILPVPWEGRTLRSMCLKDPTSMAAKNSVLVFFLALTHGKKTFFWANIVTLVVVNAVGLALTMDQIFHCHPVSAGFRFETLEEHCAGIFPSFLGSSPYNIATDVAILLIPIPLLTRMTLPLRQKLILVVTFGIAILVIVVDVVRIAFLENTAIAQLQRHHGTNVGEVGNRDYTYNAAYAFMWSIVEVNMTITCACVPTLKPLAARVSPFLLGNAKEMSQAEEGESKEFTQAPGRGENMAGEMMEVITSHPEERTAEARDPYAHHVSFVNVLNMRPASMLRLNNRESLPPNILITTLFCLWGFSYGLINVLNTRFGVVAKLTDWESDGLHAAYFGGYLIGPFIVGRYTLKRLGYAATFIVGLYIYACGTLLFWPSAVLGSVPTFIVSNIVTGAGLGLLETTANSFISMCGPLEYSEIRLCVAQGFQGIGGTAAYELAERAIFKSSNNVIQVVHAQWAYLGISFFDVLLSVIFYYLPIPEAPDEDLKELADRRPENKATVLGMPVFGVTLGLGVWSQFLYVGGQEVHIVGFYEYVTGSKPTSRLSASDLEGVGNAVFTIGRFLSALIIWLFLNPRRTLLVLYVCLIIFGALCMRTTGSVAITMAILVFLFEGGIFPIIFAISLRGTAQHAKTASTVLAAAISGGAFFLFAQHAAKLAHNVAYGYSIVVALWSAGAIFPLYLNLVPAAKRQVDPVGGEFIQEE
ncbi:hypothetical protein UA08_07871 [Talaromyces atroroseus]|uniref:Rhodopsin domain-containing protein n=1 Tax=Talaromyces atroroseus TaxID=1441469 RepID=A0A225A9Z7_TALAT|nr:hypothetical protein UA08_07871 [Talaromyces atroroseus]OKL56920.1 hypothetical protein UA08_07871 [Talaromyces atroroseus]